MAAKLIMRNFRKFAVLETCYDVFSFEKKRISFNIYKNTGLTNEKYFNEKKVK